jgi:dTDP-4-dehydrorhamnose reductase
VRVVVTGAGGLLGGRLACLLEGSGLEVRGVHLRTPPPTGVRSRILELTDEAAVARMLDDERPDGMLHAAALARPADCESRPEEAQAINARVPGMLARLCRERRVRLVCLSTDLVFAGRRPFSTEADLPEPGSAYARSKRAGEEAALLAWPTVAVARVALVMGRGHGPRGTTTESVAWSLRRGERVRAFVDEYRTPVDPESVAEAVRRLLTLGHSGIFHLAGPERISRFDLARRVARALGLPEEAVEAARREEYTGPDVRPADVSLDIARARRELGWEPRPLQEVLREGRDGPS